MKIKEIRELTTEELNKKIAKVIEKQNEINKKYLNEYKKIISKNIGFTKCV